MSILAAILILGATGHAERSMETDATIAGIVAQCVWGAVSDVLGRSSGQNRTASARAVLESLRRSGIGLEIDGRPRDGWRSWAEAGGRVGGYVADVRTTGSVQYDYRLRIRGYDIRRTTRIENGHVLLTTDAWWTEMVPIIGRITRKVPIHVTIVIRATETEGTVHRSKTLLAGTATGNADTSDFKCRLVRNGRAEPDANAALRVQLPAVLRTIEREGRLAYASGSDIAVVLDRIRLGIKIGGRLRR